MLASLDGVRVQPIGSERLPRDGAHALKLIEGQVKLTADFAGMPPLVIVDYLQDLARGADKDVRTRIGDIATQLRAIAQRHDCAMLAVSSVARSVLRPKRAAEMRQADDPAVYLAAAKESGDVDYASAVVAFLDVEDDRDQPERDARIAVAKSRHGRVGFAGARFAGASGRWLASPGSAEVLGVPGRVGNAADKADEVDEAMLLRKLEKLHRDGDGDGCTVSNLKAMRVGFDSKRVKPTLDRLVRKGKAHVAEVERIEGKSKKVRQVYKPTSPASAVTTTEGT